MNERIKELMIESCTDSNGAIWMGKFNAEQFAELIIQECMKLCDRPLTKNMLPSDNIREHFGVE